MKRSETVVLFDLDDTIIRGNSFHAFVLYEFRNGGLLQACRILWMLTLRKFRRIRSIDVKNRLLSRHRGKGRDEMDEYFRAFYQSLKGNYAPHIVRMLKAYVAKGYDVVVITGALYDYARFIAEDLGVQTVVATRLTYRDHRFTGSIEEPEMLGDAKKEYILRSPYAGRKKIFYTDSLSDIPLLLISEKGYIVTLNSRDHAVRYFRGYDKN